MSWAASANESRGNPALIAAKLRRRGSTHALYWRYKRPRARVYAGALSRLVIYRLIAAVEAIFAITLLAFAGAVAGIIGYPRWPALKSIHSERISAATASAAAELSHCVPAFLLLGLIIVIVPRPHRWLFRITMLSGGAVGYFQQRIPSFPHSAVANDISARVASLTGRIPLPKLTASVSIAMAPPVIAVLIGYLLYRNSYTLTLRTTGLIPIHPAKHYRSTFRAVSVTRRLIAALVTAGLLAVNLWLAENMRLSLPDTHYGTFLLGTSHPSLMTWLIAVVVFALAICAPRPQGYQWLLIVFIIAITVYAFLPYQILPPMPVDVPAVPASFWVLAVVYLLVTGLAFDLAGALLDWPI
jgi:hypothetical protein